MAKVTSSCNRLSCVELNHKQHLEESRLCGLVDASPPRLLSECPHQRRHDLLVLSGHQALASILHLIQAPANHGCTVSCRFSKGFIWCMTATSCLMQGEMFPHPTVFSNCRARHWELRSRLVTQIFPKMLKPTPRPLDPPFQPKVLHRQFLLRLWKQNFLSIPFAAEIGVFSLCWDTIPYLPVSPFSWRKTASLGWLWYPSTAHYLKLCINTDKIGYGPIY